MRTFILVCVLFCTVLSFAQSKSFEISGIVLSKTDKTPLESATVHVERVKDSSLVTYTITDKKGAFSLVGKSYDVQLKLFISFLGYQTYVKTIAIDQNEINLHSIVLDEAEFLDEVTIKSRAPITIKKDTLEFNVSSFKTKKDANVEDLLKKLPGVEVDEQGKIKVNGKEVSKILVNGKPFFGNDPTITTRNLSKDIIETIQITDTKSKSQAFVGEDSEGDDKTINLTIKEENNKGFFGRISTGLGTDKRVELAGMLNYFNNDRRLSVLAGGNNTNSPGFSFGEIEKMFGDGNTSFSVNSGGQGITTSKNAGMNYGDKLSDKVDISVDYFYSISDSNDKNSNERENILPDNRFFSSSNSESNNQADNHSTNLEFDIKIDSTFLINIQPSLGYLTNRRALDQDETSSDQDNVLVNESSTTSVVESIGKNFENNLSITKKLGSKGSFLRLSLNNEINETTSDDFLTSETEIYGNTPETISRDQFTDGNSDVKNLETNITYRIPIVGKKVYLDFKHEYQNEKRENIKSTFDFNPLSQEYTDFNPDLSTNFEYLNNRSEQGLRLTYRKDKLSIYMGGSHVYRLLENKDILRPELDLKRNFNTVEAYSRFRFRFSSRKSLSVRYNLRSRVPQLRQLQPFLDLSNPLNTIVGNPNLVPLNDHSIRFNFTSFDFQKGIGFYSYMGSNFIKNQVVAKTTIDENLIRQTTYTNVNGNYNYNLGSNFNKTVKLDTIKTFRFGIGFNVGINKNINFNNDIRYVSKTTSLNPNLYISFTWKDVIEIRPNYRLSFTKSNFDIDSFSDTEFSSHNFRIDLSSSVPKNFEWNNNISYNYNPNIADGFQKGAWFWNSTLSYSVLRNRGIIKFKAYDLLNQNTNARRIVTQNYIEDSQSTVLQQYFMIGFSYKFNTLGQAGEVSENRNFRYF